HGKAVTAGNRAGKNPTGPAPGGGYNPAAPARNASRPPRPPPDAQTVLRIFETAATGSQRIAAPDRFDRPYRVGSHDVSETGAARWPRARRPRRFKFGSTQRASVRDLGDRARLALALFGAGRSDAGRTPE